MSDKAYVANDAPESMDDEEACASSLGAETGYREGFQTATAQSEQRIEELERKLAEHQAAFKRMGYFGKVDGTEELTRLLQEAEKQGEVKGLRDAADILERDPEKIEWIRRMADEIEGGK